MSGTGGDQYNWSYASEVTLRLDTGSVGRQLADREIEGGFGCRAFVVCI